MGKTSEAPKGARLNLRLSGMVLSLAATLLLASCEHVNEGVADYRKADINADSGLGKPTDVWKKYTRTGPAAPAQKPDTKKDVDGDVPITKGEKFYVSLLQAYVGPDAKFTGSGSFGGTEEIVLVLRVRDSNNTSHSGRFVFYSDDVSRGQFLNFSNLLTLGPADYEGGVITIDVDEVRLAGTTEHIKDMLRDLAAKAGDQYGPDPERRETFDAYARNVFDIIENDAYGTRYTLTLMPAGGVQNLPYPRFEAGNYVLMRHERRQDSFDWDSVQLDNNTGRLITLVRPKFNDSEWLNDDAKPPYEFRDDSYVTLQINVLRNVPTGEKETQDIKPPTSDPLFPPPPPKTPKPPRRVINR